MIDDRRFVEGTWQANDDEAKKVCIEAILVRFCHARQSWCCSLTLPELEKRLASEASISKVDWDLEQKGACGSKMYNAYVTLAILKPVNGPGYEQHKVSETGRSMGLSRRACIIEILERYSGSRRNLGATTTTLEEYLAEDDLIRSVTFFLPKQDAWRSVWTTEACVTLNDKDPDATLDQISGQHYVQGDWLETADESKRSCIVKILARYSVPPRPCYSFPLELTKVEELLAEEASIHKVDWKTVEEHSETVLVSQSAYVTLNDGESLADVDPDLLTPTDGESLADTFTDSDNFTDNGLAASLDALAISDFEDPYVPVPNALLVAQEVFRKVFPDKAVPASIKACRKGLHRVWINLHDYEAAVCRNTPVARFSDKTSFLIDLKSSRKRNYSRKRAKELGWNDLLKTIF